MAPTSVPQAPSTAIHSATVTVVRAVRGQAEQTRLRVDAHEEQSQARARELKATVERHTG